MSLSMNATVFEHLKLPTQVTKDNECHEMLRPVWSEAADTA